MQRIVIIGAGGLLGQELNKHFSITAGILSLPLSHKECDITDLENVREVFKNAEPDVVINCATILDVDKCENEQALCFTVNRDGVANVLSAIATLTKPITFIQVSSSEVLGRVKEGEYNINGYREDDEPKPASAYQRSKHAAEELVISMAENRATNLKRWYIPRLGWLYGSGRKTYVEYFWEASQKEEELVVIKDQWRSPTQAASAAKWIGLLSQGQYENGIYHIANTVKEGEATTMDVIDEIRTHLGVRAKNQHIRLVARDAFFKVPRAPSNVLINTKLPQLPYWRAALQEYLKTLT